MFEIPDETAREYDKLVKWLEIKSESLALHGFGMILSVAEMAGNLLGRVVGRTGRTGDEK